MSMLSQGGGQKGQARGGARHFRTILLRTVKNLVRDLFNIFVISSSRTKRSFGIKLSYDKKNIDL